MTDRDIAWAVINADPDYMDGASGDTSARYVGGLEREVEALRAQVQAVREVCKTHHLDDSYPNRRKVVFLDRILRALDGGEA